MDLFYSGIKQNIKLIFLVLLLLFSFMSVYMTHGLIGTKCHNGHESLFTHTLSHRKSTMSLRKVLRKLKVFFHKLLKFSKILSNVTAIFSTYLQLFYIRFSKVSILYLFSFLCLYFNTGKYKQSIKSSYLLALMAV